MSQCRSLHQALNKLALMLGRCVKFIPHHGSIDGSTLNPTAICLAQGPTREAIAQKLQAMHNPTHSNPQFQETLQLHNTSLGGEAQREDNYCTMVSSVNLDTYKRMELATDTLKAQIVSIITTMRVMDMEFELSNQQLPATTSTPLSPENWL